MLGRHVEAEVARVAALSATNRSSTFTFGVGINVRGGSAPAATAADGLATEWVFASREDGDLSDTQAVERLFARVKPTHVLHLAARLQSLNEMTARPVDFWMGNVTVNNNVLAAAYAQQRRAPGAQPVRVISVLSTVMFPRDAIFPVDAAQSETGALHPAGEAYALSKRALAALSRWYNMQHGTDFLTVLPGNFFGAHGDFGAATAPLVNALIAKAVSAAAAAAASPNSLPPPLRVMGTGRPLRQLMHAADFARALLWSLEHLPAATSAAPGAPLIIAGPEHSICDIAHMVANAVGYAGGLQFDTDAVDGPLRRTADDAVFRALAPDFAFKPLEEGISTTVSWYRENEAVRN